jgi:hypothetical protein
MALRLPEPMLANAGTIPHGSGWTFEPKLDGFRCLVCTHGVGFQARSRRGWEMSHLLPELRRNLPDDVQLDGEIVALGDDGRPDFHRLSSRMLHGRGNIALTYFVFDVLAVEGLPPWIASESGIALRSCLARGGLIPNRCSRPPTMPNPGAIRGTADPITARLWNGESAPARVVHARTVGTPVGTPAAKRGD